jgi:hypothetical protein
MIGLTLIDQVPLVTMHVVGVIAQISDPGINTDFPGAGSVAGWLGGLKFLALSGCLASLFIGGAVWGLAAMNGNGSSWGRRFALGGTVGAIIVGLGAEIVNSFAGLA